MKKNHPKNRFFLSGIIVLLLLCSGFVASGLVYAYDWGGPIQRIISSVSQTQDVADAQTPALPEEDNTDGEEEAGPITVLGLSNITPGAKLMLKTDYDFNPDDYTVTWSMPVSHDGVSIDPESGIISTNGYNADTVATEGDFNVSCSVTQKSGSMAPPPIGFPATITLTIDPVPTYPAVCLTGGTPAHPESAVIRYYFYCDENHNWRNWIVFNGRKVEESIPAVQTPGCAYVDVVWDKVGSGMVAFGTTMQIGQVIALVRVTTPPVIECSFTEYDLACDATVNDMPVPHVYYNNNKVESEGWIDNGGNYITDITSGIPLKYRVKPSCDPDYDVLPVAGCNDPVTVPVLCCDPVVGSCEVTFDNGHALVSISNNFANPICEGESFVLPEPVITSIGTVTNGQWMITPVRSTSGIPLVQPLSISSNGYYIYYQVQSRCGIDTSNHIKIGIKATPEMNQPTNQVVCNGSNTATIEFSCSNISTEMPASAITYSWTNDTPSIGLEGLGTGSIDPFPAVNTTAAPIVATITVTPTNTSDGANCPGDPVSFTITVNPTPTVDQPNNQVVCNGAATTAVTFAGNDVAGVVYNWINDKPAIGLAPSDTGTIDPFTATNTTAAPIVATITVTPVAAGCTGTPVDFTITVNPTPPTPVITMNPANGIICAGGTVTLSVPSSQGATYLWSTYETTASIDVTQAGNYSVVVTIADCPSAASDTVTVTVNPIPTFSAANPAAICIGGNVDLTTTVSNGVNVDSYKYYSDANAATELPSTTVFPVVTTIYYIKAFGVAPTLCPSEIKAVTVTVNPESTIALTSGVQTQNQTVCTGTAITATVYTFGGSATNATVSDLPEGLTSNVVGNTVIISGIPTASGAYTITTSGHTAPCTAAIISGTVTVNPESTIVLTSGTQSPIVCTGTAIVNTVYTFGGSATNATVSNLSAGLTSDVNTVAKTVTISGTPTASGTYTITTSGHTAPCTAATISGTVTVSTNSTIALTSGIQSPTVCSGTVITNIVYTFGGSATGATVSNLPTGLAAVVSTVNKTVTISGTPTATGTYTITTTGHTAPCTEVTVSGTVTVNLISTIALTSGTSPQTVCAGTAITATVYTFGGSATNATVSNLPTGLAAVVSTVNKTVTISGTPTATGTYTITTSGHTAPCTEATVSGTVTVNPASTIALTSGTSPQTVCTGTAIVNTVYTFGGSATNATVSNLSAGLTSDVNTVAKTVTISGTPTASGTYTITTSGHTVPCTAATISGTVTVNPESTIALTSGTQIQTVCTGTAITATVYTFGGSATNATVSNLPTGLAAVVSTVNKTVIISGIPTASGAYTITTIGHTAPCTAATISGTVTISTNSTIVLTSGTQSPIVCTGTAIVNTVYTFGGSATNATVSNLSAGLTSDVNTVAKTVTISGTPTASGTYTITTSGHTAPCTAATISGTVTVSTNSTIALTSGIQSPTVCSGTVITNIVYTFGGSATGATVSNLPTGLAAVVSTVNKTVTISGTPTATGTYTITTTGHTAPCTEVTVSGTVTVNLISTIALTSGTSPQTVCAGTAITATVYTFGGSATNATVSNLPTGLAAVVSTVNKTVTISGTPTATGTYTITTSGHTAPCTEATVSGTVTVNPASTIALTSGTSPQTVCTGTAIVNTVYTFGGSATNATVSNLSAGLTSDVNTVAKTVTISGTPTASGTYTITTSGHTVPCTAATISGTVTVNPESTIALTSGTQIQTVCTGTAITATVYTFGGSATNATVSNLPTGLAAVVSTVNKTVIISGIPTASGAYTITTSGHTAPCTAAIISGTVTVNPESTIVLTSGTQSPIVCTGTAIVNTVYTFGGSATNATVSNLSAGLTSDVNTVAKTVTISGTPTASGTYTITTSGHTAPCTAATISGTVTVSTNSTIALTSGIQSPTVCSGTVITNIVYTFGGSATGATVSNLPTGLAAVVSTVNKTVTISGTPTATGTYTITTTGHTAPCTEVTVSGTVTVNLISTIALTSGTSPQTVCAGTAITATVYTFGGSATNATVSNLSAGLTSDVNTVAKTVTISGTPTASGTYTITTSGHTVPCTAATISGTVTVNPLPTVYIYGLNNVCMGSSITLTNSQVGGTWESEDLDVATIDEDGVVTPVSAGTSVITYTFTDENGCTNSATLEITVNSLPEVSITSEVTEVCEGSTITLTATPSGDTWTSANTAVAIIGETTGVLTGVSEGTSVITYTFTDENGCTNIDTVEITVNPIPTVTNETPNNICAQDPTGIELTADLEGTTFEWYVLGTYNVVEPDPNFGIGSIIGQNLQLADNDMIGTITYAIVPILGECEGDTAYITLNVYQTPILDPIDDQDFKYCINSEVSEILLSESGDVFSWTGGAAIGMPDGIGSVIPSFITQNTTGEVIHAEITVTAALEHEEITCYGSTTFIITVYPVAEIHLDKMVYCDEEAVPEYVFHGSAEENVTYYWERIGGFELGLTATHGVNVIPAFTAENHLSTGPISAAYSVYAVYAENGIECQGRSEVFLITVNPTPTVAHIADLTYCHLQEVSAYTFSGGVPETNYHWVQTNYDSVQMAGLAPKGDDIIPAFTAVNAGNEPIELEYTVTATYSFADRTCPDHEPFVTTTFTITVLPKPIITNATDFAYCNGEKMVNYVFRGTATEYRWQFIDGNGGPISGINIFPNINPPIAINAGTEPIHSLYAITPVNIAANGIECEGETQYFTFTVNPQPVVNPILDQYICSGELTRAIEFTGVATEYQWVRTGDDIGGNLPANGVGNINSFIAGAPGTAHFVVNPIYTAFGVECPRGEDMDPIFIEFDIVVLPEAIVTNVQNFTYCNGDTIVNHEFTGTADEYRWLFIGGNELGLPLSGIDVYPNVEAGTIQNTGDQPLMATYFVMPVSIDGDQTCEGTGMFFTTVVNPKPVVDQIADQIICLGTTTTAVNFTGVATEYTWEVEGDEIGGNFTVGHGNIDAFIPTAAGTVTITVTPVYTYNELACTGEPMTFSITVLDRAVVTNVVNFVYCSNDAVANYVFEGVADEYRWVQVGGNEIGLPTEGTDGFPGADWTAINHGNVPLTATYKVTPVTIQDGKECLGESHIFSVTINPQPVVTQVSNQYLCSGESTTAVIFTGDATEYRWVMTGDAIGAGYEDGITGVGNIDAFITVANATELLTGTFVVTPVYIYDELECEGDEMTFIITVLPKPVVTNTVNFVYCNGTEVEDYAFEGIADEYRWEQIGGSEIGLPTEGVGNFPGYEWTAVNLGNVPLSATYQVYAVTINGDKVCSSEPHTFTVVINPQPVVDQIADQVICLGTTTAAVNFTGVATEYTWEIEGDEIGGNLTAGHGNIDAFIPTAAGTVTITVTPVYTYDELTCTGEPMTFSITVLDRAVVTNTVNFAYCNGTEVEDYAFEGNADEYRWIQISGNEIGLPTEGINSFPGSDWTATNLGNVPLTATYKVTPVTMQDEKECEGEFHTFTVVINPQPVVDQIADQVICLGTTTAAVNFTGVATEYTWEIEGDEIGGNLTAGHGNIDAFIPTAAGTVTITVTPVYTYDELTCTGEPMTFSITVLDRAVVTNTVNFAYCNGTEVEDYAFEGNADEYRWIQISGNEIGLPTEGINSFPGSDWTATNLGNVPLTATYKVTPVTMQDEKECEGEFHTFTVVINPQPVVDQIADQVICLGTTTAAVNFTGVATEYTWEIEGDEIGGNLTTGHGNIDAFIPTAAGIVTITVTPVYTYDELTCTGEPMTFSITVLDRAVVTNVMSFTYCNGDDIENLVFEGAADEYRWGLLEGNILDLPTTGINIFPNVENGTVAVNTGIVPLTALYYVTPYTIEGVAECEGTTQYFTVTINPQPVVNQVLNQVVCSGQQTNAIIFTGVATEYRWIKTGNVGGGLADQGVGNIEAFTTATTNIEMTATFVVTPVYIYNGKECVGEPITFSITVTPVPVVTPIANRTFCAGDNVNIPNFGSTAPAATFHWSLVSGPYIGLAATEGVGSFPTFPAVNDGTNPITATYQVIAAVNENCESEPITFSITVNPTPHIDPVVNSTYCSGTMVPEYPFTGTVPGATYAWLFIGGDVIGDLPNAGTDLMPPFLTANTTDHVLTAHYKVTVSYVNNGVACGGEEQEFSISVLPEPTVTNAVSATYCNGDAVPVYTFEGVGLTYEWLQIGGNDIGMGATSGVNFMPSFIATNTTANPLMAVYEVKPIYSLNNVPCEGTPRIFTITVNPNPTVDPVADRAYCHETPVPSYTFTGSVPEATYKWELVSGGPIVNLPESGTNIMPAFVTQNTTDEVISATYRVTVVLDNNGTSCGDHYREFTISVIPEPRVTNARSATYCHNEMVPILVFEGVGTDFKWTQIDGENIGLEATEGNLTMPSFKANNPYHVPISATYEVSPTYTYNGNTCQGTTRTFTITINPQPVITPVANQEVCAGEMTDPIIFTSSVNPTTFHWTNDNPAIGLAASGEGNIPSFKAINNELTPVTAVIKVISEYRLGTHICYGDEMSFTITVNPLPIFSVAAITEVCLGQEIIPIAYTNSNMATSYTIEFGPAARTAGFKDVVTPTPLTGGVIEIPMPETATWGIYHGEITLYGPTGCVSANTYGFSIHIYQGTIILEQPKDVELCEGDGFTLYVVVEGIHAITDYQWYRNGVSLGSAGIGMFYTVSVATEADYGYYHVEITTACDAGNIISETAYVRPNIARIAQKWNDVLYVSNINSSSGESNDFDSYQWYKLDEQTHTLVGIGQNAQYYYEEGGLNGTYAVRVSTADGVLFESCYYTVTSTTAKNAIIIYPNPVEQNGTLTIRMTENPEEMIGSQVSVYDIVGRQVVSRVVSDREAQIVMSLEPGTYVVKITGLDGKVTSEKVIVR